MFNGQWSMVNVQCIFPIHPSFHLLESLGNKEHALRGERENVKSVIVLVAAQVVFGTLSIGVWMQITLYDVTILGMKDSFIHITMTINAQDDGHLSPFPAATT